MAEHGSRNRTLKADYRVATVTLRDNKPIAYEVFRRLACKVISAWGRPADVISRPDGTLYASDDKVGAIYRVTYRYPATAPAHKL